MNNYHHETFNYLVELIINTEGGYVKHPNDPGGETKYGISKRRFPHENIKNLTKERAIELYRIYYWDRYKVEKMSGYLRYIYFDMIINLGPSKATRIIQQAVNSKYNNKLIEDGRMGPKTRAASKKIKVDRIRSFRMLYYARRVIKASEKKVFWVGWYRRVLEV